MLSNRSICYQNGSDMGFLVRFYNHGKVSHAHAHRGLKTPCLASLFSIELSVSTGVPSFLKGRRR